jgi:hypothetical protein
MLKPVVPPSTAQKHGDDVSEEELQLIIQECDKAGFHRDTPPLRAADQTDVSNIESGFEFTISGGFVSESRITAD